MGFQFVACHCEEKIKLNSEEENYSITPAISKVVANY